MLKHLNHCLSLYLLLAAVTMPVAQAQQPAPTISQASPPQAVGVPVVFEGVPLFQIYDRLGSFTPQERAHAIENRLDRLLQTPDIPLDAITTSDVEHTTILVASDLVIMAVTDGDALPLGRTRQEIAKEYAKKIQTAVTKSREQITLKALTTDTALAVLDTIILVVFLVVFHKVFPKLYARIEAWRGTAIRAIKIQRVELLSADQIATALTGLARALRIVAVLILFYVYLTTVLGIFPWTRGISA